MSNKITDKKPSKKIPPGSGGTQLPGAGPGRPKGSKNKATLIREDIARLVLESIQRRNDKSKSGNYFDGLSEADFNQLVKSTLPKESKVELQHGGKVLQALKEIASRAK